MKKVSLAVLVSFTALTSAAYAQTDNSGITMSTDPSKAADIEQRAQDLQSRQQAMPSAPAPRHHKGQMHHKKKGESGESQ
jgi:hypothetical protein